MAKALMRKDLTNQRFGKLVVDCIDEERTGNRKVYWWCNCDCGKRVSIQSTSLTRKIRNTRSCGCARNSYEAKEKAKITSRSFPKDISGYKFGKLKVISKTDIKSIKSSDNGAFLWECECECGKKCYYSRYQLITPTGPKSCGCLYEESRGATNKKYNEYDLTSYDYAIGYCNNGTYFYFDKEDFDLIKEYSWWYDGRYVCAHSLQNDNYTTKIIRLHRVVMRLEDREDINIDHKNLIRYDCRKTNLRLATDMENSFNKENCFATLKNPIGIYELNDHSYMVYIQGDYLGRFDSFIDAFAIRKEQEIKRYGDFLYNPYQEKIETLNI